MMESLYLLLPLSIVFALGIGLAFWWAIFSGQFDDLQNAGQSVLADDDNPQNGGAIPDEVSADPRLQDATKGS